MTECIIQRRKDAKLKINFFSSISAPPCLFVRYFRSFMLSFLLLLSSFPAWTAEETGLKDFAGAMVYSGREGSLLKLEIPEEVYQGFRRPDLGDLRIFDAAGKAVPFIVRDRPREMFTPSPEAVPFFIWDGGKDNQFPSNTDIEINTSGGVVRIKDQNSIPGTSPVFLVDLSLLKYTPSSLNVETKNQGKNFNSSVSVHYSRDLSNWIPFEKKQVLASFGGSVQDTLDLGEIPELAASHELSETGDSKNMLYLLISFGRDAPKPAGMTVYFKPREKPAEYLEAVIQGRKNPDGKTVSYNTEAFYPAESIDFVLAETDSIPVLVKNRFSEKDEWNIITRGTLFRYISAGEIVKNPPFEIRSQAPYWELEASGELRFNTVPECVIRWTPRELIFPARGKGPWTLAFGNATCGPLGSEELLPLSGREEFEPAIFTGEKRYEKTELSVSARDRDYRVYILWAFLGAAVIILSLLAYNIAKSMRS